MVIKETPDIIWVTKLLSTNEKLSTQWDFAYLWRNQLWQLLEEDCRKPVLEFEFGIHSKKVMFDQSLLPVSVMCKHNSNDILLEYTVTVMFVRHDENAYNNKADGW